MEPITWLVIGLIAGWLAGLVMKGSGYGLVGDILVGLLGGVVGAWLFVFIVPESARSGLVGMIVVAVASAAVFVGLARVLTRRTVRA
ncbi:MAG: GlsB/YeaQ/YmgE family stress response membrane protein [Chloroflexota bacterium]|nr:GlsB/YeaQ/YmgE family stress response membrane protein [Chloroflexota bacterium]